VLEAELLLDSVPELDEDVVLVAIEEPPLLLDSVPELDEDVVLVAIEEPPLLLDVTVLLLAVLDELVVAAALEAVLLLAPELAVTPLEELAPLPVLQTCVSGSQTTHDPSAQASPWSQSEVWLHAPSATCGGVSVQPPSSSWYWPVQSGELFP
jgi:hypothetical protein